MKKTSLHPRLAPLLGLLLAVATTGCGESAGALHVFLTSSPNVSEDPLDPTVVRWLRVRVEGPGMGVVVAEGPFERGGSTRLPPVPAGEGRRIFVEGLTGPEGLLVSRGESRSLRLERGQNEIDLYMGLVERFSVAAGGGLDPPRSGAGVALSSDGTVLVIGGRRGDEAGMPRALPRIESFDPTSGRLGSKWECGGDSESCEMAARWNHAAVALADGVFFAGGVSDRGPVESGGVCRDGRCDLLEGLSMGRTEGVVVELRGGGGVVFGGFHGNEPSDTLDVIGTSGVVTTLSLDLPPTGEAAGAVSHGEDGIIAMGFADAAPRSITGNFLAGAASVSQQVIDELPDRDGAALVALPDGRVLIIGGRDSLGALVPSILVLDPFTGSFCEAGNLIRPRWRHSASRLRDGRVLVVGGVIASGLPTAETEMIDPRYLPDTLSCERLLGRLEVRTAARLAGPRSGHASLALSNGFLLVAGGVDGHDAPIGRLDIFVPAI